MMDNKISLKHTHTQKNRRKVNGQKIIKSSGMIVIIIRSVIPPS